MELSGETKDDLRLALASHQTCIHEDPAYCHMLIIAELALRQRRQIADNEEIDAIGHFIADAVLESLMLKGMIEVAGLDENGEFMIGLTEAGHEYTRDLFDTKEDDGTY